MNAKEYIKKLVEKDKGNIISIDDVNQSIHINRKSKVVDYFFGAIFWETCDLEDIYDDYRVKQIEKKAIYVDELLSNYFFLKGRDEAMEKMDPRVWKFAIMIYLTWIEYCSSNKTNSEIILAKINKHAKFIGPRQTEPDDEDEKWVFLTWKKFDRFIEDVLLKRGAEISKGFSDSGKKKPGPGKKKPGRGKTTLFQDDPNRQEEAKKVINKYLTENCLKNTKWSYKKDDPIGIFVMSIIPVWEEMYGENNNYYSSQTVNLLEECGVEVNNNVVKKGIKNMGIRPDDKIIKKIKGYYGVN